MLATGGMKEGKHFYIYNFISILNFFSDKIQVASLTSLYFFFHQSWSPSDPNWRVDWNCRMLRIYELLYTNIPQKNVFWIFNIKKDLNKKGCKELSRATGLLILITVWWWLSLVGTYDHSTEDLVFLFTKHLIRTKNLTITHF